jgi:hypothetical protein
MPSCKSKKQLGETQPSEQPAQCYALESDETT